MRICVQVSEYDKLGQGKEFFITMHFIAVFVFNIIECLTPSLL